MNVCVVALGKIGLPLAVQFARSGHQVIGADIDERAVSLINVGTVPFPGEADLDERLGAALLSGSFQATTDTIKAVASSSVVVVVVPLLVDRSSAPDFRAMDAATADIAKGLQPGTLVIYETTLPVGTTRQRFAPALAAGSGLVSGSDFFVAFSPERVYSGRIFSDLRTYPKLVGGTCVTSTERAIAFYESALQFDERSDLARPNGVWDLGSAEAAELAKLAETTYRDVNIGFANELAKFSDANGIDVAAVIAACNSQPFSHIHQPGVAVGGHCIPVYPRFYLSGDPSARLPAAARSVNESMPAYAVARLESVAGTLAGKRVAILGVAYRGGVKEPAFSGVFPLAEALSAVGAIPLAHDPLFSDDEILGLGLVPYHLGEPCSSAVVQADHAEYRDLESSMIGGATVVLDGRRCVNPHRSLQIVVLGNGQPPSR